MKLMSAPALACLVLAITPPPRLCSASPKATTRNVRYGSIEGVVVDGSGAPIRGAKVFDEPLDSVRIGKDHFTRTDENGHFLLKDVPAGKTMVIATKLEDGYPDARYAVYSGDAVLPTVYVRSGETARNVLVKLLAKGGKLRGRIVEANSGVPVPRSRITLSRLDHPNWSLETDPADDGTFDFVLPTRPLRIQVTAPGFKAWTYPGPIQMVSGEQRDLLISLERLK
jgi:hypothetical protein